MSALGWRLILPALLLLAPGCGPRRTAPPPEEGTPSVAAAPSLEFGGSVIRVSDPKGSWKFEARSPRVKAAGVNGPYTLMPADATYQEEGKEPVLMHAERADVDRQTQRVALAGSVQVASNGWVLEADHVTYDLKTGKVVSPGRTKLSLGREALKAYRGRVGEEGKRP